MVDLARHCQILEEHGVGFRADARVVDQGVELEVDRDAEWVEVRGSDARVASVDHAGARQLTDFHREAAWMFEAALASWDGVAPEMRALLTYLVGELWRRAGDCRAAAAWFARVRSEVVTLPHQRWIIEVADQQRDDPREWFDDNKAGGRPSGWFGRSVHRPVVVERGPRGGAGFSRILRRAAAVARRAAAAIVGGAHGSAAARRAPSVAAPAAFRWKR